MKTWHDTLYQQGGIDCIYNYMGDTMPEREQWLVGPVSNNRDADLMTVSNWEIGLRLLGGEGENLEIHRFAHWAIGWFELILIRPGTKQHEIALQIETNLMDYPILDDEDLSQREFEDYCESWDRWIRDSIFRELDLEEREQLEERLEIIAHDDDLTDFELFNEAIDRAGIYPEQDNGGGTYIPHLDDAARAFAAMVSWRYYHPVNVEQFELF